MGAGLGGGSADAAFTIKLLDHVLGLKLTDEKMQDFARQLGSDCPFFIKNTPAFAFERGDMFEPVSFDLSDYFVTIVKPNIHISTPEAYSWIIPSKKKTSLNGIIQQPIDTWKDVLINDFEKEVFKRYPLIESLKMKLYSLGADYASMTGSGAAVFALSKKEINVQKNFPDYSTWQGKGVNF
jgi:4-diphosphocytidyl-2-C-methyl-D-erythritol kinase